MAESIETGTLVVCGQQYIGKIATHGASDDHMVMEVLYPENIPPFWVDQKELIPLKGGNIYEAMLAYVKDNPPRKVGLSMRQKRELVSILEKGIEIEG